MKIKPLDPQLASKVGLSFYVTGFQDYIGSRLLLNHSLLLQGATLASTAVEKYVKALLSARNQKAFGHLNEWSSAGIIRIATELSLNPDFFALLQQIYRMRYIDDLKAPVSFAIERSKFLAELDQTVASLNNAVEFRRGNERIDPYKSESEAARKELLENNIMFSGKGKAEYLQRPDLAEAFYIDTSLEILSCVVTGWIPIDLARFTEPGIVRVKNEYQCQLVATAA